MFNHRLCTALALASVLVQLLADTAAAVPDVLQLDIQRVKRSEDYRMRLRERDIDNTISEELENEAIYYFAEVYVGTPPQLIHLDIDTGSSDTWVQTADNPYCQSASAPCAGTGTFAPENSSTFIELNEDFSVKYADGTFATGYFALETLEIDGITLSNLTIGLATNGTISHALMGLGYPSIEPSAGDDIEGTYPNLPVMLVDQGYIQSRVFSLYLNDREASSGTLLFGGIDKMKYSGDLVELKRYNSSLGEQKFYVALEGLGVSRSLDSDSITVIDLNTTFLLDSGSTSIILSNDTISGVMEAFDAFYSEEYGHYVRRCELTNPNATIDFQFPNVTVKINVQDELLLPQFGANGKQLFFTSDNAEACYVAITLDDSQNILGDRFLRSAYVVYDMDNDVIGMAQTVFNETASDIVAVGYGPNAIANALSSTDEATSSLVSSDVATATLFSSYLASDLATDTADFTATATASSSYSSATAATGSGRQNSTTSTSVRHDTKATSTASDGTSAASGTSAAASMSSTSGASYNGVSAFTGTIIALASLAMGYASM
ncbi:aspartic peptidase domain-containing protein [Limtongia smithiae]|uniref:aspartic peptidase domain-containing protein n=1 Tax=Limtongia smithiae TaxID=1125753 RepID=UPI0034CE0F8C